MDVGSFRVKDVLYNLDEKGREPVTTCRSAWVGVNWGGGGGGGVNPPPPPRASTLATSHALH